MNLASINIKLIFNRFINKREKNSFLFMRYLISKLLIFPKDLTFNNPKSFGNDYKLI